MNDVKELNGSDHIGATVADTDRLRVRTAYLGAVAAIE